MLGLFALQAFWIYTSLRTHNKHIRSKIEIAEVGIKKELEEDYFCFKLSHITQINQQDSLVVLQFGASGMDTLSSYRIGNADTSMIYPKHVFGYSVPMWLQMELRFDFLLDSLTPKEVQEDTLLMAMQNDYRRGALIDSVNGMRVGYRNSLHRVLEKHLATIEVNSLASYALFHKESNREVYASGEYSDLNSMMEVELYDNAERFSEPYVLKIYSRVPWMRTLLVLAPLLIASILIMILAGGVFFYGLNAWRKERMLSSLRRDMMHGLSHEMNTPISNIRLAIQALQKKNGVDPERENRYLHILEQENNRLADNVSHLMDYTQMEENQLSLELRKIELNKLIHQVMDSFKEGINLEQMRIDFFQSKESLWILGDENHLISVFYNLLGNAVKYSGDNLRLEVYSEKQEKQLMLCFMDNNTQISERSRKKVFDKYYRESKEPNDSIQGYGLGLYYVRKIVRELGGNVELEDSYYGGNSFVLKLPLVSSK